MDELASGQFPDKKSKVLEIMRCIEIFSTGCGNTLFDGSHPTECEECTEMIHQRILFAMTGGNKHVSHG